MRAPERSPERDAAIEALLPSVPFDGWTSRALRTALSSIGVAPEDAEMLFPGGAADMVESWSDLIDRRMPQAVGERVPDRVRAAIAARLESIRPAKEAVRRGLGVLAANPVISSRVTARTVDAIWHAAGDRSADWSWYTKRAILAGVYGATLLFWLRDDSDDDAATLAFLDRRLAGVGRLGRVRRTRLGFLSRCRIGRAAVEPQPRGGVLEH
jgi:ubiquinone biosynthesis protein COQ9